MRKFDETEMKMVKSRSDQALDLAKNVEKQSIPGFEGLLDILEKDKAVNEMLVAGGIRGEAFSDFLDLTKKYDEELIFLIKWCLKGFEGIKNCSEKYSREVQEAFLEEK